jgi:hypothetical protein
MEVTGQLHTSAIELLGIQPLVSIIYSIQFNPELGWVLERREKFLVPVGN